MLLLVSTKDGRGRAQLFGACNAFHFRHISEQFFCTTQYHLYTKMNFVFSKDTISGVRLKLNFVGNITVNSYLVARCRLLSSSGWFWNRSEGF